MAIFRASPLGPWVCLVQTTGPVLSPNHRQQASCRALHIHCLPVLVLLSYVIPPARRAQGIRQKPGRGFAAPRCMTLVESYPSRHLSLPPWGMGPPPPHWLQEPGFREKRAVLPIPALAQESGWAEETPSWPLRSLRNSTQSSSQQERELKQPGSHLAGGRRGQALRPKGQQEVMPAGWLAGHPLGVGVRAGGVKMLFFLCSPCPLG